MAWGLVIVILDWRQEEGRREEECFLRMWRTRTSLGLSEAAAVEDEDDDLCFLSLPLDILAFFRDVGEASAVLSSISKVGVLLLAGAGTDDRLRILLTAAAAAAAVAFKLSWLMLALASPESPPSIPNPTVAPVGAATAAL